MIPGMVQQQRAAEVVQAHGALVGVGDDGGVVGSSSSVTSNIGTALSVLANNSSNKHYLSNSISLHGDVNTLINVQTNEHHLSTSAINEVDLSNKGNDLFFFFCYLSKKLFFIRTKCYNTGKINNN